MILLMAGACNFTQRRRQANSQPSPVPGAERGQGQPCRVPELVNEARAGPLCVQYARVRIFSPPVFCPVQLSPTRKERLP